MPRGALIGRIFGTDIYATMGFLLLMAFLLLTNMDGDRLWIVAVWELALILSVLAHEFGHVFAVRWRLKRESLIVLWGLGGLCIHEPAQGIGKRITISLMGPAFGFALGGACWLAWEYFVPETVGAVVRAFMEAMIVINIYYTALNLLPILPLDGGQAALAALEIKLPRARALRAARRISVLLAAAGLVFAIQYGEVFLVLIVALLLFQNLFAARHGV